LGRLSSGYLLAVVHARAGICQSLLETADVGRMVEFETKPGTIRVSGLDAAGGGSEAK
jgi:hypothetical protein